MRRTKVLVSHNPGLVEHDHRVVRQPVVGVVESGEECVDGAAVVKVSALAEHVPGGRCRGQPDHLDANLSAACA